MSDIDGMIQYYGQMKKSPIIGMLNMSAEMLHLKEQPKNGLRLNTIKQVVILYGKTKRGLFHEVFTNQIIRRYS